MHTWVLVSEDTSRMAVPGGWLYRSPRGQSFVPSDEVSRELLALVRDCEPFVRYSAALGQSGAAVVLDEIERRGLA